MKNDFKSVFSNPIVTLVLIGIIILPSLYALLNIQACWDPYGNTGNVEFAIANLDNGSSFEGANINVGNELVKDSGLSYQLTGMGTQIEAENLEELYSAIANAQEAIFKLGIGRAYTVIKVDDRRDMENRTLDAKVDTVNEMLK